jgi:hypothetical protein
MTKYTAKLENTFFTVSVIILSIPTLKAQVQKGAGIEGESYSDQSGRSVSMPDANTVAIGSYRNDGGGRGNLTGHVRVYTWDGTYWVQKGADIDGEAVGDYSGWSVSMPDANTIAIGALYGDSISHKGYVRVYSWSGTAWVHKGGDIDGEAYGDESGFSVNMPDANTIAIGAPINGNEAGHVRVYAWSGNTWTQKGVDIDGEAIGDKSGFSVSMPDANTIAIGAPNNGASGYKAGHVRVYAWSGAAWVQKGVDIDGEASGDESGCSVSMPDANTIAIGAPGHSIFGEIRVYIWNGTAWLPKGAFIVGKSIYEGSGYSVSMPDANTVAFGAPYGNQTKVDGDVRVYTWSGATWVQKGVDIYREHSYDFSGFSVSMPDANTLGIGAPLGGRDLINNPTETGRVRVFSFVTADVSENSHLTLLKLYPNPASNILNVEVGREYLNSAYSIVDNTGRNVLTGNLQREVTTIQLGDLPSGVYTICVEDGIRQTFLVSKE